MKNLRILESGAIVVALALLFWGLFAAFQFPIYSDEFAYRLFLERFFINGGFKQSVTPYCPEGFLVAPPLSLLPAAVLWSALSWFDGGFWSFRIVPSLCWTAMLIALYRHGQRYGDQSFWPLMLLLFVGPCAYSLVLLRPEIVVLALGVTIYCWGSFACAPLRSTRFGAEAFLLILAYILALYMHPKAVYLAPAITVALLARSLGITPSWARFAFVGTSVATVVLAVVSAVGLHKLQYMSCEAYPSLEDTMRSQAINPMQMLSDPIAFFQNLREAFAPELWNFTSRQVSYWQSYEVDYLPGTNIKQRTLLIIRFIAIALILSVMIATCWKLSRIVAARQRGPLELSAILLLLVGLGLIGPLILNLKRHFYDVALLVGSVVLVGSLAWPLSASREKGSRFGHHLIKLSCCYLFLLAGVFGTWMNFAFFTQIRAGYEGPSISTGKLKQQLEITLLVKRYLGKYGISVNEPLVIDDWTYDTVRDHPKLYPISYLSVNPDVVRDMPLTLTRSKIRYGVVRCNSIPALGQYVAVVTLEAIHGGEVENTCLFKLIDQSE